MTGRERIEAVLAGRRPDRLCWTTLVDSPTLNALPEGMRGLSGLEFYRRLGCDVFLLNCWDMPENFQSPVLHWPPWVRERIRVEGDRLVQEWQADGHTLRRVRVKGHPVEMPVKTLEDARLYRRMWSGAHFEARDDLPLYGRVDAEIGDQGIVTRFWGPSAVPMLLEDDMGMMTFYDFYRDEPDELDALIRTIHEKHLDAFRILAEGPCSVVILVENTSTFYIHPEVYRVWNGPQVKDFVDAVHRAGKVAIIHMCGHVLDILSLIKLTGLDGVHALTPPPTGNTPWETALDVLGEDTIIIGALDPTVFALNPVEQIGPALDRLYTPRLRRSRFILAACADGIAVPWERFEAVADWMRRNGALA